MKGHSKECRKKKGILKEGWKKGREVDTVRKGRMRRIGIVRKEEGRG